MDETHHHQGHSHSAARAYWMLGLNLLLSLIVMYLVMYTMIDGWPDYRNNINMLYMALTMWAPMGILMIVTMGSMYQNARTNIVLYAVFALVTLGSFWATRSLGWKNGRRGRHTRRLPGWSLMTIASRNCPLPSREAHAVFDRSA